MSQANRLLNTINVRLDLPRSALAEILLYPIRRVVLNPRIVEFSVLAAQGFQVVIDRADIDAAERWKERLGQLILGSDIVVFVLSPDSVQSPICEWEVDEAMRHRKRIIPVLCRSLEGKQPPVPLRDLNYIYFYPDKEVPGDVVKTVRFGLDHVEDLLAKDPHQLFGIDRTDAADHPGREVLLDAINRCRR
jgi:hypothetical protein